MTHELKYENMTHNQGRKESTEADPQLIKMMLLTDLDFKISIVNI